MGIYAHIGTEEPHGTEGRVNWKTEEGMDWLKAMKFMRKAFPGLAFVIYEYTSFYDDDSYKKIYTYHGKAGMSPALG
tara:strand:+ start:7 stop:237 length:231 start_codon:yes stop_codon:yes gene_type:complete